jgi:hypothetical protein
MEKVFTVLGWFVLATLALAIARQLSEQLSDEQSFSVFSDLYSYGRVENFTVNANANANPADASLNPRTPYNLLDMPANAKGPGDLTAKTCYENDFLAQTQKTGNYIQRTNNFRHAAPDSCSAPMTEFVDSFYKAESI